MNMRNVNIVARYESKLLRRDIVFLGFVVIALVGISLWQMIKQGRVNVFWYKVALPSSFPFFPGALFFFQHLFHAQHFVPVLGGFDEV